MKLIRTQDAVGQVLCHDITQIIPGITKDAIFRKGHIVQEIDIEILLSVGKEHLYIWEADEQMLHENEAAEILCELCRNQNMYATEAKEGKIELIAEEDGLLLVDVERLRMVNSIGNMMIATRTSGYPVKKGEKLCGTRIIPLIIEKNKMEEVKQAVGEEPLLKLLPLQKLDFGIINTGSEIYHGLIEDRFTPVLKEKMEAYGCKMKAHVICDDNPEQITATIQQMDAEGIELILCTGGMSVDPDDRTPLAIKNAGVEIVSYGAPVLPGAMFLVSYLPDDRVVCGLPGCVMYSKRTIFDIVLPWILAGERVTPDWLAGLGHGGLCLSCEQCHFPNCAFGKGM
ncbi:MAG: molybdopterin-binding protein [Eubacteriales bacterium]